jgi:hypothetical protein
MILPPMLLKAYEDRGSDCELALDVEVQEVIDHAVRVGWKRTEAMKAIVNLVLSKMAADAENRLTKFRVAQALDSVEH